MFGYTTSRSGLFTNTERRRMNNMKICRGGFAAVVLTAVSAATGFAQPAEPGGPPEIIVHRTNPHKEAGNPPAGPTGTITPVITWHGGPVMGAPKAYLIWYGN